MGVYIKSEEIPKSCSSCFYAIHCNECGFKTTIKDNATILYSGKKPDNCPLIEIKEEKIKQLL